MEGLLNLNVTATDCANGEINWSIVHRFSVKHTGKDTTTAIVRRVKKELGISNVRSITDDMGDSILIWYENMIAYVSFPDEEGHPSH
jgi:isopentenyldiphosphate isomerase